MRALTLRALGGMVLAGVLSFAGAAWAQDAQPGGEPPADVPRTQNKVKTIFDYAKDLGLTDKQEQEIRAALQELVKSARVQQARLVIIGNELEELVSSEGDLKDIRAKLVEAANIQAEIRYTDIATSRKINGIMSPEQLARWKDIQEKARADARKGAGS